MCNVFFYLASYYTALWNVVRICWYKPYYQWDVLWHAVKCYGVNLPFTGEEDQKITKRPARMLRQCARVIDTHGNLQNKSGNTSYKQISRQETSRCLQTSSAKV